MDLFKKIFIRKPRFIKEYTLDNTRFDVRIIDKINFKEKRSYIHIFVQTDIGRKSFTRNIEGYGDDSLTYSQIEKQIYETVLDLKEIILEEINKDYNICLIESSNNHEKTRGLNRAPDYYL